MPVLKFRVSWEEEDTIYRDIAVLTGQTFLEFHEAILKAFEFDNKHAASFYESNDKWMRFREISSEVMVNKKDAPALAMIKTPVSALVDNPNKKFIYEYDKEKKWTFLIEFIGLSKDENFKISYPHCFRKEGIAPAQSGIKGIAVERMMEIEEKYDLGQEEMDEGFTQDNVASDTEI
jgi:hypothetical protein